MREEMLTVSQAAAALGLKVPTIRTWIWQRRIPVVKLGRSIRIEGSAIREIIEQGRIPAADGR
jgi:excisionase family DNA binding protein